LGWRTAPCPNCTRVRELGMLNARQNGLVWTLRILEPLKMGNRSN
jgi:hypothetical protein